MAPKKLIQEQFMNLRIRRTAGTAAALALAALLTSLPATAQKHTDAQIQADAQKQLSNKKFSGVQVQVQDGVVHLTGQVNLYADKADAQKRVDKLKEASSIQNDIAVGGPSVSDAALFQKLGKGLTYDRVGYGTTVYNSITLQVHDGIATIGGVVYGPADKDSAIGLVANTPGVKGIVDNLQVAPVSPMDNRIRIAERNAIYGAPQLNRYAIDPAKPIRITVVNGHVTLTGMVSSQSDKDVAGIRANGVPGVFSVQNNLQVAGQTEK
jgi:hyperosmotically inducible periplasmic protein